MAKSETFSVKHKLQIVVGGEGRRVQAFIAGVKVGLKLAGLWRRINRIQIEAIVDIGKKLDDLYMNGEPSAEDPIGVFKDGGEPNA